VANCGYVTASAARGRGIARQMCLHSLEASQGSAAFARCNSNFVVSHQRGRQRYQNCGPSLDFNIVGEASHLPFEHPTVGDSWTLW